MKHGAKDVLGESILITIMFFLLHLSSFAHKLLINMKLVIYMCKEKKIKYKLEYVKTSISCIDTVLNFTSTFVTF